MWALFSPTATTVTDPIYALYVCMVGLPELGMAIASGRFKVKPRRLVRNESEVSIHTSALC
jgi:hypothetical protein